MSPMEPRAAGQVRPNRWARAARPAVFFAMPLLGVANQYCAERVARALPAEPIRWSWLALELRSPWLHAWVGLEILTFTAWMVVLAELSLSAAFPMTALGYVLVMALGWGVLHERLVTLDLFGGALILAGVWLLGREPRS
jgi:multidrug transporter EmrE-like cation transporter